MRPDPGDELTGSFIISLKTASLLSISTITISVLLLTPDSAFDFESYFGIIQNTHVVGFTIFTSLMILHKNFFKEKTKFATI